MWYKSSNSNAIKPAAVDKTSSSRVVYLRKDFTHIPEATVGDQVTPEHWEYMECKIPVDVYVAYEKTQQTEAKLEYVAIMADIDIDSIS